MKKLEWKGEDKESLYSAAGEGRERGGGPWLGPVKEAPSQISHWRVFATAANCNYKQKAGASVCGRDQLPGTQAPSRKSSCGARPGWPMAGGLAAARADAGKQGSL